MDDVDFMKAWVEAEHERELKEALLHDERFLSLLVEEEGPSSVLAGCEVREISLVEGALIALVHRGDKVVIPRGRTRLEIGDSLTIVGDHDAIHALRERFRVDRSGRRH
ncbi:MAG: TrkA C-terminal domain-containing protein [Gemmatimonadota bacterium]